ncbi:unnamed protein product, partial [Rotaria sordida]
HESGPVVGSCSCSCSSSLFDGELFDNKPRDHSFVDSRPSVEDL